MKPYKPKVGDRITLTRNTGKYIAVVTRMSEGMVEWRRTNPTLKPKTRVNLEDRETFLRFCASAFSAGAKLTRKARK